jgi:hypothetical protein
MRTTYPCRTDDCDCNHCHGCGCHTENGERSLCDDCQINGAARECESVTKAFGGNYEEAARFMGW